MVKKNETNSFTGLKAVYVQQPVHIEQGSRSHRKRAKKPLDQPTRSHRNQQPDRLAEINETSRDRLDRMIPQMAAAEGVNKALKACDPMAWVAGMNSILHRAEESILAELIYG